MLSLPVINNGVSMRRTARLVSTVTLAALPASGCWWFQCFAAGTRILTPRGARPIEELLARDVVWSWDTAANAPVERSVIRCLQRSAMEVVTIQAEDITVATVTPEHPFWDPAQAAWVEAGRLTLSSRLLAWGGDGLSKTVRVDGLSFFERQVALAVFNLEVAGPEHNYFADGVLVHNKSFSVECDGPDGSVTSDQSACVEPGDGGPADQDAGEDAGSRDGG